MPRREVPEGRNQASPEPAEDAQSPETTRRFGDQAWYQADGAEWEDTSETHSVEPSPEPRRTLRDQLGWLAVNGTAWAEEHRRPLLWGGLLASGLAAAWLARRSTIPGWTRYTSISDVPERCFRGRTLPVLVDSFASSGALTSARVVHYPALRRWADIWDGRPAYTQLQDAVSRGETLTVQLSGVRDVTAAGREQLLDVRRFHVHRLRLLSVTERDGWGAAPVGAVPLQVLLSQEAAAGEGAAVPKAHQAEQADAARDASSSSSSSSSAVRSGQPRGAVDQGTESELLWGELWAKPAGGVSWRHPLGWRRRDVAEQLLAAGAGRAPEAEDLDYLGVARAHVLRLRAAEDDAIFWGRGIWYQHTMAGRLGKRLRRTQATLQGVFSWRPWRFSRRGLSKQHPPELHSVQRPAEAEKPSPETRAESAAAQAVTAPLRWLPSSVSLWARKVSQQFRGDRGG